MQSIENFKEILTNLSLAMGDGWKPNLINIDKITWRGNDYRGYIFNNNNLELPKKINVEYNCFKNKIIVTSIYQSPKYYAHNNYHDHKTLNISLNNRTYKTIAKMINNRVLIDYDEVVKAHLDQIKKEQNKREQKTIILDCIRKVAPLRSGYQSNTYYVDLDNKRSLEIEQNFTLFTCFDLKAHNVGIDKLIEIITILQKETGKSCF